jgi:hypothetical protein
MEGYELTGENIFSLAADVIGDIRGFGDTSGFSKLGKPGSWPGPGGPD